MSWECRQLRLCIDRGEYLSGGGAMADRVEVAAETDVVRLVAKPGVILVELRPSQGHLCIFFLSTF